LTPDEVEVAVEWLSGALRQRRIGIGPAAIHAARPLTRADNPLLLTHGGG
jgi:hypothetical protein